ncbi:hypothetical protein [Levilactobacillus koreensis]|nr:hypothetical protein [Levilactobacillus koreensis]
MSVDTILSIIASVLGIIGTGLGFYNQREIKKMKNLYEKNNMKVKGNNSYQQMGDRNKIKVNRHDK